MSDLLSRVESALLGRYRVEREVGSGAMATVFGAEDLKYGRKVAIKVLDPEVAQAVGVERFLREIQVTANLRHPHILPLYDSGEADGLVYYVTPFVEGGTLRDRLEGERQLPVGEAVRIGSEVAEALGVAHDEGLIHRDIKPENILLERGHALVADFGIARAASGSAADRLTQTGISVGTAAYMSPEQVAGTREIDGRSDLYSLGCVLYEMLTGEPPFAGTGQTMVRQHLAAEPQALSVMRPSVPEGVARAVERTLEKTPADRFSTAAELVAALESGVAAKAVPSRARRWPIPLAVSATAAAAVLGAMLIRSGPTSGPLDSVAVLPFENASSDPEGEYLSIGLTESLIDRLSQIENLRVVPRGVVYGYADLALDMVQTARELGVRTLVTGRVAEVGGRLLVRAELTDVSGLSQLWGQEYDRPIDDILKVQADLARQISGELEQRLIPEAETRLAGTISENPEAYRLTLKSRHHTLKEDREGILKGLDYGQQAVDLDPTYALGWVVLADAHMAAGFRGLLPMEDSYAKARFAASRALELAPDLPSAIAEMAIVKWFAEWDFAGGHQDMRRVLEMDPDNLDALTIGAMMFCVVGEFDEAIALMERALELDPFTPDVLKQPLGCLTWAGRHNEALAYFDKLTESGPEDPVRLLQRPALLQAVGRDEEAIDLMRELLEGLGSDPASSPRMATTYARAGQVDRARDIVERVDLDSLDPVSLAALMVDLGDADRAMDALELALEARAPLLPFTAIHPRWDPLRDDPRFQDLLRRIGVTD